MVNDTFLFARLMKSMGLLAEFGSNPDVDWLLENGFCKMVGPLWDKKHRFNLTNAGNKWLSNVPCHALKVHFDSNPIITRHGDSNDRWDRDDTDEQCSFSHIDLKPGFGTFKEALTDALPGETVTVVTCTYTEGDTFGRSSGHFDAIGAARTKHGVEALEKYAYIIHDDYFGGCETTSCHLFTMPSK